MNVDLRPEATDGAFLTDRRNQSQIDANQGCNLQQSELFSGSLDLLRIDSFFIKRVGTHRCAPTLFQFRIILYGSTPSIISGS